MIFLIVAIAFLVLGASWGFLVPTNPYGVKEGPTILPPKGTHYRRAAVSELVSVATMFGAPLVFMAAVAWRQPWLIAVSVGLVGLFFVSTWASHAPVYRDALANGDPVDDSRRARGCGTAALAAIMGIGFVLALVLWALV